MADGIGLYNQQYSQGERKKPLGNFWRYAIAFFLFLNFWWCVGMIIIGATAEKPPKTPLCVAILVCGVITMAVTFLGTFGFFVPGRMVFAVFSGLEFCMIIYQFGLMVAMYANEGKYLDNLKQDPKKHEQFKNVIQKGRGAFIAFLIFQVILLVLTLIATWLIKPGSAYTSDDPEADQRNRDALSALASERGAAQWGGSTFAANYGKIRGKMQKKYGKFIKESGLGRF